MRGKKAKAIRKMVYGDNMSHRTRTYQKHHEPNSASGLPCICSGLRRQYQNAKKVVNSK